MSENREYFRSVGASKTRIVNREIRKINVKSRIRDVL